MKIRLKTILAVHFAFLISSTASNAELSHWKDVGNWNISFDSNIGICVASTTYDSGTGLSVGLSNLDSNIMLIVYLSNQKWISLEIEKLYIVEVEFGDETPWTIEMDGIIIDSFRGLRFKVDANSEISGGFMDEFMREAGVKWTFQGRQLAALNLTDSRAAFDEVVACAKSYRSAAGNISDPFSTLGQRTGDDPFAQ